MGMYSDIQETVEERLGRLEDERRERANEDPWSVFQHYSRVNGEGFDLSAPEDLSFLVEMCEAECGQHFSAQDKNAIKARFGL